MILPGKEGDQKGFLIDAWAETRKKKADLFLN